MTTTDSARRYVIEIILIGVLLLAAALRLVGIGWDRQTHMHPDERFLTMVETSLQFPESIGQYFDTATSTFNPNNVGHTFFVYGTLPIFLVRIVGEWISQSGYDQIHIVGRAASALFDTVSVFLIYLIGVRLYSRRVGVLAAAFAATSVLLIQHAHFFVVDSFANTFILAGIYFAVRSMDKGKLPHYVLFGVALGMAVASKISAVPLAGVIVLASIVRLWGQEERP
ncbi:MAG: ArnT family glycosyltransferase, partial [Anaerolineales bacterium]